MQLNRKTSGKWENSRDFIAQDLDTVQRTINDQQQTIITLQTSLATLQAQVAASNIAIAASGQVSGIASGRNLQTVAHDQTLTGKGTPVSPLSVNPTYLGSSYFLRAATSLTNAQIKAWNTTPITIASGSGTDILYPLLVTVEINVTVAFLSSPSMLVTYSTNASNLMDVNMSSNTGNINRFIRQAKYASGTFFTNYAAYDARGKGLVLRGSANPTDAGTSNATGQVVCYYASVPTF